MVSSPEDFIERWAASGGSERANFQRFAIELTQLLGVDEPKLATDDDQGDDYRFERPVRFGATSNRSHGFIDLYRKGCFVLEAKQGVHCRQSTVHWGQPPAREPGRRLCRGTMGCLSEDAAER
ncbi:MAG: type IIL restriction-modification enzyme MmeI [Geminicoccaceae bacterium]